MNQSYLSYQPNDFFWLSVEKDFDFSVCDKYDNTPTTNPPPNLLSGMMATDSSCNCPTTSPPISNPTLMGSINSTTTPSSNIIYGDNEYERQVCINYLKSRKLGSIQNITSTSQLNFSDNTEQYNRLILKTFNVTLGIIAIAVTIGFS
jgi:hypothetical protein